MADFKQLTNLRDYLVELSQTPTPKVGFGMQAWVFKNGSNCELHEGFCGTTACLAGHAWFLFDNPQLDKLEFEAFGTEQVLKESNLEDCVSIRAEELLGLSPGESDYMFSGLWAYGGMWPSAEQLSEIPLEDAIRYLDLVLKYGDVFVDLDGDVHDPEDLDL